MGTSALDLQSVASGRSRAGYGCSVTGSLWPAPKGAWSSFLHQCHDASSRLEIQRTPGVSSLLPNEMPDTAMPKPPVSRRVAPPVLGESAPVSPAALRLVSAGIHALWRRIVAADPGADASPLLLSYDVHPTAGGPVLIEVNTNAGGVLAAIAAARQVNDCCAEWEQDRLHGRLLELFGHDLLGGDPRRAGVVAIVDDALATQPLLGEMHALAAMMRDEGADVRVIDVSELNYSDGRLRHGDLAIDRIYWRSTDFMLEEPRHESVRRAVAEGTTALAPSVQAYHAIADKRRFVEWSQHAELARDAATGQRFLIAQTVPMSSRTVEDWHADRKGWVFKPATGHGSRGVYVGKSISWHKLRELPLDNYLAQRYYPHPQLEREGASWKYDIRFFGDRGQIIGAAARLFQGQVMGMRTPGSGFAPIRVDGACCLLDALAQASVGSADQRREMT